MTLNFNISNFGNNAAANAIESAQNAKASKIGNSGNDAFSSALSVTQGLASKEDIAAASISDAVLRRDDPLGNLVKSAFNLPPPPPPWETL